VDPRRPGSGPIPQVEETLARADLLDLPGYVLVSKIGEGGMGEVFLARDNGSDRHVAIKVVSSPLAGENDAEALRRLEREASLMARLDHPGIVKVERLVTNREGRACLVMEYVEGADLETILLDGRLPVAEAVRIVMEIGEALESAHRQGVYHRDVKPANVLFDRMGRVKLVDFGLAQFGDEPDDFLAITGKVTGSLQYLPPERGQRETENSSVAGDVFSLGVLFYRMLTGRLPVGSHPQPSEVSATPPELDMVVARAMAHDPEDRFLSARELRDAVQSAATEGRRPCSVRALRCLDGIWSVLGVLCLVLAFSGWARTQIGGSSWTHFVYRGASEHGVVGLAPAFLIPLLALLYSWAIYRMVHCGGSAPTLKVPEFRLLPARRDDRELGRLHLAGAMMILIPPVLALLHLLRILLTQQASGMVTAFSDGSRVSVWHWDPTMIAEMATRTEFRLGGYTFYPFFQPLLYVLGTLAIVLTAVLFWYHVFRIRKAR